MEQKKPIPLESLAPLPEKNAGREWEKTRYWNTLLTGDLAAVPAEVRQRAGAADESLPAEERDYRLASSINRSWMVDHRNMSREQVQGSWPELRKKLAGELGVQDDEDEVYAGLSLRNQETPIREQVRHLYEQNYAMSLQGLEDEDLPADEHNRQVSSIARECAAADREAYLPLAESLSEGWSALHSLDTKYFALPEVLQGAPGLVRAVDELAELPPAERAKVYALARSLESTHELESAPENLGQAMLHSMRRGTADIRHSLIQGAGHIGTALTKAAGENLNSDTLRKGAAAADKRLQALDELRRVAQGEVFPINLGEESSFLEELAVDTAGAVPGTALAFMGGAGFGALTLAGTGAAVAEARKRAPEGRQELQTAAGIVGGAIQAGIYMGMSRIGAQMLNRSISEFVKAGHAGAKGYSLAALKSLGTLTAENAKLLLAGKAAHAAELGMQELAAKVDRVASNIDWEQFGDNILDVETNIREAAMNLPYVLIAAGRAALHHFRNPDAILDNEAALQHWGVDDAARQRILEQPDIHFRTAELRQVLRGSRRWGGTGSLEECIRALCLLNTDDHQGFKNREEVRDFLKRPAEVSLIRQPELVNRDAADTEVITQLAERMGKRVSSNIKMNVPFVVLYDEWFQRARAERMQKPEEIQLREQRFRSQLKDSSVALPHKYRLDGYYTPYRNEAVGLVVGDQVSEIIRLTYQYLLNTETPDALRRAYKTEGNARMQTEKHRRNLVSSLCLAMEESFCNGSASAPFDKFSTMLEKRYMSKRDTNSNAPLWIRQTPRSEFAEAFLKSVNRGDKRKWAKQHQLREACMLMMGLRSCAETLVEVLPHSADFQTLLTMGYSPEAAFSHLLKRNFEGHYNADTWNPPDLDASQRNDLDNRRRLEADAESCARYMKLSGYRLESSCDEAGKKLWHIRQPNGQYTPWFSSYGLALNALMGQVRTLFLPMGKKALREMMEKGYHYASNGKTSFHMHFLYPQPGKKFTGYDHLGSIATRDLVSRWLENSTMYPMGLEFAAGYKKWKKLRGGMLSADTKLIEDGSDSYLTRLKKVETPLSLARMRFLVYWHRQLSSGWVTPEDAGQTLLQAGAISPEALEGIMVKGRESKIVWGRLPLPERRRLRKLYPDGIKPGDKEAVVSELARHMANLNVIYMLADMPGSHLPSSVREWIYTSAFSGPQPADEHQRLRGLFMLTHRRASEQIKEMIPRIEKLRERQSAGQPLKLASMLRDSYEANESRRYEQGWCFSIGGPSAFRSAGQSFWNLLDDPARGWKLLTPEDRLELQEEIREWCRDREPEAALRELSEVLQQYPGLRAYSSDFRLGGKIKHMELDSFQDTGETDPVFSVAGNSRTMRPLHVRDGFTVRDAELPEAWQADERVLPALQLLTGLRRMVTTAPHTDEKGIWWRQERYGGPDGKRPRGVDSRWESESGLASFMGFYQRVAEMGDSYGAHGKLNVCGVPLGGIRPGEIDPSVLNHVTIYQTSRMPEHQVRLMPGEPNAANPYQRKPYVVHTADGIPLFPGSMARYTDEIVQTFTPLNVFNSDLNRMYDFDANNRWRRRHMLYYLNEMLEDRTVSPEAWEKGDERKINNLELFMQMFQDSRLAYYLEKRNPSTLTRGEALAAELGRLMLLAEYGTEHEQHVESLVEFCRKLRTNHEDKELLLTVLNRVVSPYPDTLMEIEKPRPEEDRELDLSPEDAEYY